MGRRVLTHGRGLDATLASMILANVQGRCDQLGAQRATCMPRHTNVLSKQGGGQEAGEGARSCAPLLDSLRGLCMGQRRAHAAFARVSPLHLINPEPHLSAQSLRLQGPGRLCDL